MHEGWLGLVTLFPEQVQPPVSAEFWWKDMVSCGMQEVHFYNLEFKEASVELQAYEHVFQPNQGQQHGQQAAWQQPQVQSTPCFFNFFSVID